MEIKLAGVGDIPTIQNLAYTIWPVAYESIISQEQIQYMLDLIYNQNALESQIKKGHQFIIASHNDAPIGFASYSIKSLKEPAVVRLHKIYVLPNQPIKGIGSFLLNHIEEASKVLNAHLIELNVNKFNNAIEFYKKKNFQILKEEVIDIGNGYVMDDYVMMKNLNTL